MTFDLRIHHITFVLEAQSDVHMGPQAGGQIRGGLWHALNEETCTAPAQRRHPDHALHCPMCFLLELQASSSRGDNPPRPFGIFPPLAVRAEDDRIFLRGDTFEISMTLMGKATALFPYLVHGMHLAGQKGVGYGRGRFSITAIQNRNPLTGDCETLLDGMVVRIPKIAIQRDAIIQAADQLTLKQIRLRFLTPTTLKHEGTILRLPNFQTLIGRLLERCQALAWHYGETSGEQAYWQPIYDELTTKAATVQRVQDNTRLVQFYSGSRRSNYSQTIEGFVGEVLFAGDMSPFLEWLLWGQSIQVGKNTVKGNGWYEIASV
jgi:hypothetical protein